jgi:nucleoside phosphorylase
MPSLSKEDYTVGWICALPEPEWKASRVLLDEEHETIPLGQATKHQYVYGSMNGHNVVMGCLPAEQLGKASAASVASEMGSTFPSLRFGLLVGIGGGVPGAKDVRLGDVVVSLPDRAAQHGGVIQYDFGKATSGGAFERMGVLNQPPEILLSAVGKVKSAPRKHSKFLAYLESEEFQDESEFAERPQSDTLFRAGYSHIKGQPTCSMCDALQEVDRPQRKGTGPAVHYGTIASGDQVMKDAEKRDEVSERLGGVLCFEMEAAGLMNRFPCLVVRGICDYCDSHKNKDWQPLAAAAAAAWTKELLRNIAPTEVQWSAKIGDVVEGTIRELP